VVSQASSSAYSLLISYRSIYDVDGPEMADTFYENLFRGKEDSTVTDPNPLYPDTMEAARALHIAVGKLRGNGVPFMRWVPFIHYGV
jgi:hypothetical protein